MRGLAVGLVALTVAGLVSIASGCGQRHERSQPTTPTLPPPGTPVTFGNFCAACHGLRGEGVRELRTPSIAGLPTWYVSVQFDKFRSDIRGADPADPDSQRMHTIARALDEAQIATLASTIAAMPRHPTQDTLGGDATRGRLLYEERCMACHRYNGSGELAFKAAPLTGLQDWYLVAQLRKFRAGIRGRSRSDEDGSKMHQVASDLDDSEFRDVVAHIAHLARRYRD
jgi:cytochrome c553